MPKLLFILLSIIAFHVASAQTPDGPPVHVTHFAALPDLGTEHEFDGINISQYAKFWEQWHLITVRYRKDNNEQRFVYANDLAYKAMTAGEKVYPDGAMFGKIAFNAQEDEAFPNSLEPKGFTRIQLMKKNSAKYTKTNGWGYGFYAMGTGVPYVTAASTVQSCHACHQIVPARDYVFSRSAFAAEWPTAAGNTFYSQFVQKTAAQLSSSQNLALEASGASVTMDSRLKISQMPLFAGAVNESIGPLIQYARKDQMPFLLIDENSGLFLVAVPTSGGKASCSGEIKMARAMKIHSVKAGVSKDHTEINRGTACANGVKWESSKAK